MKELTITAKGFAELFADADKMVALREIDEHGRETGRKVVCKVVSASKSLAARKSKRQTMV